jgi:serine/threonine-protein kinase RsbT
MARGVARDLGFMPAEVASIGVAVSELATNLVRHAVGGEIDVMALNTPTGTGIQVESRDAGPGITDTVAALRDGFSTSGGLGSGLPGVRRLMDEFNLTSTPAGTRVVCRKWLDRP